MSSIKDDAIELVRIVVVMTVTAAIFGAAAGAFVWAFKAVAQ